MGVATLIPLKQYEEPVSTDSCLKRMAELQAGREEIELQLGKAKRKTQTEGLKKWRERAKTALKYKTDEYRYLKNWLTKQRRKLVLRAMRVKPDPTNPKALLGACLKILDELEKDGDLNIDEREVLYATREYFRGQAF